MAGKRRTPKEPLKRIKVTENPEETLPAATELSEDAAGVMPESITMASPVADPEENADAAAPIPNAAAPAVNPDRPAAEAPAATGNPADPEQPGSGPEMDLIAGAPDREATRHDPSPAPDMAEAAAHAPVDRKATILLKAIKGESESANLSPEPSGPATPAVSGRNGQRRIALRDLPLTSGAGGPATMEQPDRVPSATVDGPDSVPTGPLYYLLPFSAKTEEALTQKLRDIADWLRNEGAGASLQDIAYTLQIGRSHFSFRSALVVKSREDLLRKFAGLGAAGAPSDLIVNDPSGPQAGPAGFPQERGQALERELSADWIGHGPQYQTQWVALARLYVAGYDPDWRLLHQDGTGRRISMPSYPFARERCWLPETAIAANGPDPSHPGGRPLHYLIDSNESTLEEQCFGKEFQGSDFFLRDHRVENDRVLPGVVYLEMARAAGALSRKTSKVSRIHDTVWSWPLRLAEAEAERRVGIRLFPSDHSPDMVEYEVTSFENDRRLLHSRGQLGFTDRDAPQPAAETVDIPAVQGRCTGQMTGTQCYQWFKEHGLNLGASFRTIRELRHNDREAIARLELPEHLRESFGEFELHPALMDGALEVVMGLVGNMAGPAAALSLPFALDEAEWLGPLPQKCYSYAQLADEQQSDLKFDVRILDDAGAVWVKLKGFSLRAARGEALKTERDPAVADLFYDNLWEPVPFASGSDTAFSLDKLLVFDHSPAWAEALRERLQIPSDRVVLVKPGAAFREEEAQRYELRPGEREDYLKLLHSLKARQFIPDRIIHHWSGVAEGAGEPTVAAQLEKGIYSLFQFSKAWLTELPQDQFRLLYLYPVRAEGPRPLDAAMGAFVKTVQLENSKLNFKTLGMPAATEPLSGVERVIREFRHWDRREVEVCYENEQRRVRRLRQAEIGGESRAPLLRENGVYLITGGLGALGLIFAKYLAQTVKARLALVGRSAITSGQGAVIRELEGLGAQVLVLQADVSNSSEMEQCVARARERFGRIDGVLHCAGIHRDAYLVKKTGEEIAAVLDAKITGTLNLDRATAGEKLDFFVMFSSIAALVGNPGQCDYAFANAFMDQFAAARAQSCALQQRHGKTLSINWPLWQEGGMRVDAATAQLFAANYGLRALDTRAGWNAFLQGLQFGGSQILPVSGDRNRFEQTLEGNGPARTGERPVEPVDAQQGLERIRRSLAGMVHQILKIKAKDLVYDKDLGEYGFNSLTFTEFAHQVNQTFNLAITPARFFEYPTIGQFAQFLWNDYPDVFSRPAQQEQNSAPAGNSAETPWGDESQTQTRRRFILPAAEEQPRSEKAAGGDEPIAIIGMSGVMPQSEDLEVFWENLLAKRDLITEIPAERWDWREWYAEPGAGGNKTHIKWGGFMKEFDRFDPLFFGIAPREAEYMDPQQRIFMETVWRTVEDSGYQISDLSGARVGLFVGVSTMDYMELMKERGVETTAHTATGLSHCILANRISYLFNFRGPSEPVDTACSSSLIAIHRAVESIRGGDCDLAIAGGVNVILAPTLYISFGKAGMLSPDGRCRSFDKQANGYARGEGSGAILLKPLSKAVADGDPIYAVIKGTAVNHGGRTGSLTAPNPNAQAELLISAYEKARIDPSTVSYIEAHGTGTHLGDPIEINGLKKAFAELYRRWGIEAVPENRCGIGTVKTNIGHLETAAGIAGVLKVLLALKHRRLPGNANFQELNPYIQLEGSPFYIVGDTAYWPGLPDQHGRELPRRAGVSSFGFGGANAHIVLEEYPDRPRPAEQLPSGERHLFVLSAKSAERLKIYAGRMTRFVERAFRIGREIAADGGEPAPAASVRFTDLIYTLQVGREAFEERLALIVAGPEELLEKLTAFVQGKEHPENLYRGNATLNRDVSRLIVDGKEGEVYTRMLVSENNLTKLAQLWVLGVQIDWRKLRRGSVPRRISLPSYPFERQRYWFDSYPKQSGTASLPAAPLQPERAERSCGGNFPKTAVSDRQWEAAAQSYRGNEVNLEIRGDIALVRMEDKANKNMFSETMVAGLIARFKAIQRDETIKVAVVTGYENVFCMGGTRDQLLGIAEKRANFTDIPFLYRGLLDADIPVIAAIQGHASGGGLLFGLYADIVVMAEEAVYSAVFTKYGFTPGMGATLILNERFGPNLAVEMMYTAKSYRGEELRERGVSVIVRPGRNVLEEALAIARLLADKPRHTLRILKRELAGRILNRLAGVLERETEMHDQSFGHPEVRQRIQKHFGMMQAGPSAPAGTEAGRREELRLERPLKLNLKAAVPPDETAGPVARDDTTPAHPDPAVVGRQLVAILGDILHVPETGLCGDASFKDLGVDSISAVEVVRDINKLFHLNLDTVALYDHSTIAALAQHIVRTAASSAIPSPALSGAGGGTVTTGSGGKVVLTGKAAASVPTPAAEIRAGRGQIAPVRLEKAENAIPDTAGVGEPWEEGDESCNGADAAGRIYRQIIEITGNILHLPPGGWNPESSFKDLGVDSISGVEVIRDLNKAFRLNLETVVLYECATVAGLARHIQEELNAVKLHPGTDTPGAGRETPGDPTPKEAELKKILEQLQAGELELNEADRLTEVAGHGNSRPE
jgi:acyl transferase domain-containing protein/enoyl-CoA hydratase/carnithine racemase/acyl carrier protein